MSIAIINYDLGNLASVLNACEFIGAESFIAQNPQDLDRASHIILPGVGAFGEGMENLNADGWSKEIHTQVQKGKIFLGICLGMQLLAETGTEHGTHQGLGLVKGVVDKLETSSKECRIPHIGWNTVRRTGDSSMYDGQSEDGEFYFVHSYVLKPEDENIISGICNHGVDFTASLVQDNVWGAQYHPEKSQKLGLNLLKNFWACKG